MSQGDKQGNFYSLHLLKKQSDMNSYVDKIKKKQPFNGKNWYNARQCQTADQRNKHTN